LWGRARRYYVPSFPGPLSIKSVPAGRASWTTDEARHELGEASYLIVNDAHPYTLEIESEEPVETFCIFFARGFVENALDSHRRDEALLEAPESRAVASFREVLQSRDGSVGAGLFRLRQIAGSPNQGAVIEGEDALVRLALAMVAEQQGTTRLRDRVRAVKASTRDEILRRLCVARDVLEGSLDETLRLDELARRAHLSPFHLHRHFQRAFGETPQAYRTRRRLEKAAAALKSSSLPVTDIALDAGFSSLGSFSSLFKRRFGVSPLGYRVRKEQD
jgi:AraC family transcriptional regulator